YYVSIEENVKLERKQFEKVYAEKEIQDKEDYLRRIWEDIGSSSRSAATTRYLSGPLQTWYIPGDNCGSIASAICMRYYFDYVSTSYVVPNCIGRDSLIYVMQQYVGEGATGTSSLEGGLNVYFFDMNINNYTYSSNDFSFNIIRNRINAKRPVIIDTDNHPVYYEHWLIAHGYSVIPGNGEYVIVNDGWEHNDVWLSADDSCLDELIYFRN
ncbi:MAG: hypothetical protein K6E39_06815, partial [Lachnospiraceae bacterium]|nr:hypothetical protein [Lachnospiraceae bacterium]